MARRSICWLCNLRLGQFGLVYIPVKLFFFQAEDGIRDRNVTGVQTCALPISDARWLAHLLRLGVLPEGYIYPKAERAVRDVLRKRAHLVRQQTANVLSLQNIIVRNTGVRLSAKRIHALTVEELERLLPVPEHVLAVTSSLVVVHCLAQQITTLEKTVQKHLKHTSAYAQLQTVAGIGPILAQTIVLETGDIGRFPTC